MKKMKIILCALFLMLGVCPQVNAEETSAVCVLQVDENGNILNEEEYAECLKENGYEITPLEGKWPGDPNK